MDSTTDQLEHISLEGNRIGSSSTANPLYQFVDTSEILKGVIGELFAFPKQHTAAYIDLEGVKLSRHGSVSLMQIFVPEAGKVFLIDIHTLGTSTFTVQSTTKLTLKIYLESKHRIKYFFDVRNDSDALFALFGIRLAGVKDIQLLEVASRNRSKLMLCGLAKCIEKDCILPNDKLQQLQDTKATVTKLFAPEQGGSYDIFNQRPLPGNIIDYCVQDVQFLPSLASTYESRLGSKWAKKAAEETIKRLEESRSSDYEPRGEHKKFGPKSWLPKNNARVDSKTRAFVPSAAVPHSRLNDAVPAEPVYGHIIDRDEELERISLRTRPVQFVPEGSRPSKAKKKHTTKYYGPIAEPDELSFDTMDLDWALCDKDCGWCGHCADGVL